MSGVSVPQEIIELATMPIVTFNWGTFTSKYALKFICKPFNFHNSILSKKPALWNSVTLWGKTFLT